MKIKLELFGASRDFSDKDHLEIEVQDKASIDDLRNEIIKYIDKNLWDGWLWWKCYFN